MVRVSSIPVNVAKQLGFPTRRSMIRYATRNGLTGRGRTRDQYITRLIQLLQVRRPEGRFNREFQRVQYEPAAAGNIGVDGVRVERFNNIAQFFIEGDEQQNNPQDYYADAMRIYNRINRPDLFPINQTYLLVRFQNDIGDEEFRSLRISSLSAFMEGYNNVINRIAQVEGSDVLPQGYTIDTSWIRIERYKPLGEGGCDTDIFKSDRYILKNPKSNRNNCLIKCLLYGNKSKGGVYQKRANAIRKDLNIENDTMIHIKLIPAFEEYFKTRIYIKNDEEQLYKSKAKYHDHIDLFLKDNHFAIIKSLKKKYQRKHVLLLKKKVKRKERKKKAKKYKTIFCFFDGETHFDKRDFYYLKMDEISWYDHPADQKFDFKKDKEEILKKTQYVRGDKCVRKFVDHINMDCPQDSRYVIVGFNNSKFDNFFFANECKYAKSIKNMLFANNSILTLDIDRHKTIDLCRFLMCSLKKACNDFRTNPKKIDGFDHSIKQKAFEDGVLDEWFEKNNEEVVRYCKYDVLSLCDLTMKFKDSVKQLKGVDFYKYITIGHMAYDIWRQTNEKENGEIINPKPLNLTDDKFIRSSLVAGRTQAYYGKITIETALRMVDAKSLYPFVMKNRAFPIGQYKKTDYYMQDKLGIYNVKVIHQNMIWKRIEIFEFFEKYPDLKKKYAPVVVPLREKDKPLNWNYRGEFECRLSSIDIDCITRNGGKVEVYDGIYWEESSKDVFAKYIADFENEKNRQDKLKAEKSKDYNPALRNFCKLALNSLSGKVAQRNFEEAYCFVNDEKSRLKFEMDVNLDSVEILSYGSSCNIIKAKLKDTSIFKETAKPSYLAIFIYAYAREYMYESILNKYCTLYQDTDSALMHKEEFDQFEIDNAKDMDNGQFGCWEEEVGEATKAIILSPKNYMVHNPSNEGKSKRKMKGVRKSDTYITVDECCKLLDINKQNNEKFNEQFEKGLRKLSQEDIRHMKGRKVLSNKMFEELFDDDIVVIQSLLKRMKGNIFEKDTKFRIKQCYMLKRIKSPQ